jgi:hypothetical protein
MLASIIAALHFGQAGRSIATNGMMDDTLRANDHETSESEEFNLGA